MTAVDRRAVNRFLSASGLPPALCRTLDVLAAKDPSLAMAQAEDEKTKLAAQARQASAPRRRRDLEAIVARACAEGRFSAERAPSWRSELDRDPAGPEKLLTVPPEQGGLVPCAITAAGPPELTAAQEQAAHEQYMRDHHRNAARAVGYSGSSRWAVEAREGRVTRINSRT